MPTPNEAAFIRTWFRHGDALQALGMPALTRCTADEARTARSVLEIAACEGLCVRGASTHPSITLTQRGADLIASARAAGFDPDACPSCFGVQVLANFDGSGLHPAPAWDGPIGDYPRRFDGLIIDAVSVGEAVRCPCYKEPCKTCGDTKRVPIIGDFSNPCPSCAPPVAPLIRTALTYPSETEQCTVRFNGVALPISEDLKRRLRAGRTFPSPDTRETLTPWRSTSAAPADPDLITIGETTFSLRDFSDAWTRHFGKGGLVPDKASFERAAELDQQMPSWDGRPWESMNDGYLWNVTCFAWCGRRHEEKTFAFLRAVCELVRRGLVGAPSTSAVDAERNYAWCPDELPAVGRVVEVLTKAGETVSGTVADVDSSDKSFKIEGPHCWADDGIDMEDRWVWLHASDMFALHSVGKWRYTDGSES